MLRWLPALCGTFFVQEFGGEHHDDEASPIGNCIAEKRASVRLRVGAAIEDNPAQKD